MNSFDLQRMLESKRAFRRQLAARPLTEKLRLLDELRERALVIRRATASRASGIASTVAEDLPRYGDEKTK